jgi:hypothetical protein
MCDIGEKGAPASWSRVKVKSRRALQCSTAGLALWLNLIGCNRRTRFLFIGYDRVVPDTHVDQAVVRQPEEKGTEKGQKRGRIYLSAENKSVPFFLVPFFLIPVRTARLSGRRRNDDTE